ncbi:hypothetical protein ACFQ1Q_00245 [Winogradskyella litorisediminis]|uniref:Uncharacterized protein n=1 Tax=Winogradskyella litorisediminis TaxID=1156618 RepID=A0ABW3N508_9FLAO
MKNYKSLLVLIAILIITSCVQETHLKTITFKVDMRGLDNITNPGVRGQFTSPAWKALVPLTDENNDSIYEAKVEFQAAQYDIKFKFVNNDEYELQNQPNRSIKFEYEPENFTYEATFNTPEAKTTKK